MPVTTYSNNNKELKDNREETKQNKSYVGNNNKELKDYAVCFSVTSDHNYTLVITIKN